MNPSPTSKHDWINYVKRMRNRLAEIGRNADAWALGQMIEEVEYWRKEKPDAGSPD